MEKKEIIKLLPYTEPFLFVEEIEHISEEGVTGNFRFPEDAFFYRGHFKEHPVTPGVILTECMAQIGVVCLGIFLLKNENLKDLKVALSGTSVDFYLPVYPEEKVRVISEKEYFRFNKLKCKVKMLNAEGKLVCKGEISGMVK